MQRIVRGFWRRCRGKDVQAWRNRLFGHVWPSSELGFSRSGLRRARL